jgi:hypothetical protein
VSQAYVGKWARQAIRLLRKKLLRKNSTQKTTLFTVRRKITLPHSGFREMGVNAEKTKTTSRSYEDDPYKLGVD